MSEQQESQVTAICDRCGAQLPMETVVLPSDSFPGGIYQHTVSPCPQCGALYFTVHGVKLTAGNTATFDMSKATPVGESSFMVETPGYGEPPPLVEEIHKFTIEDSGAGSEDTLPGSGESEAKA